MDDSNEPQPNTLNLFGGACDAARLFPDIVSPDEAGMVTEICRHDRELFIRCRDRELDAFLEEVDGLDLGTVPSLGSVEIDLPSFIPVAERGFYSSTIDLGTNIVGIQLRHTFSKRRGILDDVVKGSSLLSDKQVIQFSSGRDDLIEPLWADRDELGWFKAMGRMGLAAATGVNFSVYECMCPTGQHLNIKKSLVSASLMRAAGVPAIPHFYAVSQNQRYHIVRWLNARPDVRVIAINCQSQKEERDRRVLKQTIAYILENTNREVHIILEGFRIPWLEGLYPYLPYLHIAQKQPFMDALAYDAVDFDSANERFMTHKAYSEPKEVLAARSIQARRAYLEHLHKKHAPTFRIPRAWWPSKLSVGTPTAATAARF